MIYAVDTNVLLDVFTRNERHGPVSRERLREAYDKGTILVSHVVYDELVPAFVRTKKRGYEALHRNGALVSTINHRDRFRKLLPQWLRY